MTKLYRTRHILVPSLLFVLSDNWSHERWNYSQNNQSNSPIDPSTTWPISSFPVKWDRHAYFYAFLSLFLVPVELLINISYMHLKYPRGDGLRIWSVFIPWVLTQIVNQTIWRCLKPKLPSHGNAAVDFKRLAYVAGIYK